MTHQISKLCRRLGDKCYGRKKKDSKGNGVKVAGGLHFAILHVAVKVGLVEKVVFKQRCEGGNGVSRCVPGEDWSRQREQPVQRS